MLADGQTTKMIALILKVSAKDIEYHRQKIVQKLGIPHHNIALITRAAVELGLIEP